MWEEKCIQKASFHTTKKERSSRKIIREFLCQEKLRPGRHTFSILFYFFTLSVECGREREWASFPTQTATACLILLKTDKYSLCVYIRRESWWWLPEMVGWGWRWMWKKSWCRMKCEKLRFLHRNKIASADDGVNGNSSLW